MHSCCCSTQMNEVAGNSNKTFSGPSHTSDVFKISFRIDTKRGYIKLCYISICNMFQLYWNADMRLMVRFWLVWARASIEWGSCQNVVGWNGILSNLILSGVFKKIFMCICQTRYRHHCRLSIWRGPCLNIFICIDQNVAGLNGIILSNSISLLLWQKSQGASIIVCLFVNVNVVRGLLMPSVTNVC